MMKFELLFIFLFFLSTGTQALKLINGNLTLSLDIAANKSQLVLKLGNVEKISAEIGRTVANLTVPTSCEGAKNCLLRNSEVTLNISAISNGWNISWESANVKRLFQDCINLNGNNVHWFGGPQMWHSQWPIEKVQIRNRIYTTIKTENGAISERYWLNSEGGFVFVADKVPLFVEQNSIRNDSLCFNASVNPPYEGRKRVLLQYVLVGRSDPKEAHLQAVNQFLGKPKGIPSEHIIRKPIWTTWAKYKKDINESTVLNFGKDIAFHGFSGQLEIDDFWETCYGSLTFNTSQFPNAPSLVRSLHALNFTVSLWTHPFVNDDCTAPSTYGEKNNLFVKSVTGDDRTDWWDGNVSHYIDFTKESGSTWFSSRLKLLQTQDGIDSFKFDAGECDYPPTDPVASGDLEEAPNSITAAYIRTVAQFGGLIEVRAGWRTQDLPIFVRMIDKDSRWNLENGLHALITTLLQFNMVGYVFVLPDMIGGNGYGDLPTAELLVRWTQANAFMPSMQFSYLPWEFSASYNALAIVKKYISLHEQYADEIIKAMEESGLSGTPVNPPIWWVDPTNKDAHQVNDQYLLGEKILVAPVIVQGATSRNIVLPKGSWKDGNTGRTYQGPQLLQNYAAPIDILPYFIKQ